MTQAFCTLALITLAACAQAQTPRAPASDCDPRRHGRPGDDG